MLKYLLPAVLMPLMFSCIDGSRRDVHAYELPEGPTPAALASVNPSAAVEKDPKDTTRRSKVLFLMLGHTGHAASSELALAR